ncbi:MAG: fumarylacetoacetate hydrolase family protein [Candidatus Limnocylindrales bacterium]|jgi:2-keto-4-pentenoate hydratase/2-oxohepta-3-ene-1,7-dioic acid hydratase in catechol pathway
MRFVTFRSLDVSASDPGGDRVAVVLESGRLLPLGVLAAAGQGNIAEEIEGLDLATVIALDPEFGAIRDAIARTEAGVLEGLAIDPATVRLAAPIPAPGKAIGVGYNYRDHIREQGLERPERPVLFSMFGSAVAADGDPIRKPAGTHALDLEAGLAVVIGRRASRVAAADGLSHVAGYTVANDVTARDWQGQAKALRPGEKGDGQWLRAKGSDTFLPLGPVLVTADELGDGRGLRVRSWRTAAAGPDADNAFLMQDGNTSELLFGVAELISIISREVTLNPGDVIVTGTPSGVGVFREPQIFLEPGDLVRVEVERIGALTSPVVDENGEAPAGSPAAGSMAMRTAGQVPPVSPAHPPR